MPPQAFLTLFIFNTFAFKKKRMRSLHAYTPVSGSFTSEPLDQSVNGTSIRSFKKKGRSSRALQFTNKLTSEELKFTGTRPLLANYASFMK